MCADGRCWLGAVKRSDYRHISANVVRVSLTESLKAMISGVSESTASLVSYKYTDKSC